MIRFRVLITCATLFRATFNTSKFEEDTVRVLLRGGTRMGLLARCNI